MRDSTKRLERCNDSVLRAIAIRQEGNHALNTTDFGQQSGPKACRGPRLSSDLGGEGDIGTAREASFGFGQDLGFAEQFGGTHSKR